MSSTADTANTEKAKNKSSSTSKPYPLYYEWKCQCGKHQFKITGEPVHSLNCYCHSCVAPMRHIADKYPGGTSANSSTTNDSDNGEGGAAGVLFRLVDISGDDVGNMRDEDFGYVKVGSQGRDIRTYTKCCGSMVNVAGGDGFPANFACLNRNAIYMALNDGTTEPYRPDDVPNINAKHAFEPNKVPEPRYDTIPIKLLGIFVSGIIKKKVGLGENSALKGRKIFCATGEEADIEVVPITWE